MLLPKLLFMPGVGLLSIIVANQFLGAYSQANLQEILVRSVTPVVSLETILQTLTATYTLSSIPSDAFTAQQICQHHGGNLLSVASPSELEDLQSSMNSKTKDISILWTSGIRYSNATVENLVVWSSNLEPFPFPLSNSDMDNSDDRVDVVRNRRSVEASLETIVNRDCCPCSEPPPPPPENPVCKRPNCTVTQQTCMEVKPRQCLIARSPTCTAQEKNCTVDCGTAKDCRVIQQPVCTVVESERPRCRLEVPNLGQCKTIKPQTCRIISPGQCHSRKPNCVQEAYPPCIPKVKHCKNPCSQQECVTVQPPCTTTPPQCVTTKIPCPEIPPPSACFEKCRKDTVDKEQRHECDQACKNGTASLSPSNCGQNTVVCPEAQTYCPPPVTTCTKPFVDCSPIMCQSNVFLCPPARIKCEPPQVFCDPPRIECDEPDVSCPEPEVICEDAKVDCTKPIIKCPDPVVHCNPIVTTCEAPSYYCSDPEMRCPNPDIQCGEPVVCPVDPRPPPTSGGGECSCKLDSKCVKLLQRTKRAIILPPSELEYVEKTECIAITAGIKKSDWLVQSCKLQHRFVCKILQ